MKGVSGSAAAPAWSFAADTTTGTYLVTTGKLGLAANGVQAAYLDATQIGVSDNIFYYPTGVTPCPVGMIVDWPGATVPVGWLFIYGQVVAQATYPGLYAVCGTTYNTGGEGAGNFRLPDGRGRVTAGRDNMGGSTASRLTSTYFADATVLGAVGGLQSHTLTVAEVPALSVSGTTSGQSAPHTHTYSGTSGVQNANHTHPNGAATGQDGQAQNGGAFYPIVSHGGGSGWYAAPGTSGIEQQNHAHDYSGTTSTGSVDHSHTYSATTSGGGGAHTIVQPTIIFNKIIFAGR